jgi:hypothetical protein
MISKPKSSKQLSTLGQVSHKFIHVSVIILSILIHKAS